MHIHINTQFTYVNCVKAQERKWRWEKHYISTKTNPKLKPNRRIPRNQKSNKNCIQKKGKRKSNNKNFMILLCHRFDNRGRRRKRRNLQRKKKTKTKKLKSRATHSHKLTKFHEQLKQRERERERERAIYSN